MNHSVRAWTRLESFTTSRYPRTHTISLYVRSSDPSPYWTPNSVGSLLRGTTAASAPRSCRTMVAFEGEVRACVFCILPRFSKICGGTSLFCGVPRPKIIIFLLRGYPRCNNFRCYHLGFPVQIPDFCEGHSHNGIIFRRLLLSAGGLPNNYLFSDPADL